MYLYDDLLKTSPAIRGNLVITLLEVVMFGSPPFINGNYPHALPVFSEVGAYRLGPLIYLLLYKDNRFEL